jgi:hypothetical protein
MTAGADRNRTSADAELGRDGVEVGDLRRGLMKQ